MMRQMLGGIVVAAYIAVSGCSSKSQSQPLEVGQASPSLELKTVTGGDPLAIESLKGEFVVLNFWSTSCSVCMKELDDLKEIHQSGKAKVIGVALDEDSEQVRSVIKRRGVEYPVLLGDQATFERFDGYTIPYTLVLDRSHVVLKRFFGRMSQEDLEAVLNSTGQDDRVAMNDR